jgi:predicted O-methyltransferase YrrM
MEPELRRRKRLKAKQRVRILSHQLREAALGLAGKGLGPSLRGLPRRAPGDAEIWSWLDDPATRAAYEALGERAKDHPDTGRKKQTVADADCFALFALTRGAGATTALEIGTNLGLSTVHIAGALQANGMPAKLTTVDIIDVNDETVGRFRTYGAAMSAGQRVRAFGLADGVAFVVSPSETFLKRSRDSYDLIFVDGDHSEAAAYFDIMRSLLRLNERGILVLHDYNDPDDPTEGLKPGLYGVHWAIDRLKADIPDLAVIRLRAVTPPGSTAPVATSLAVVTRRP